MYGQKKLETWAPAESVFERTWCWKHQDEDHDNLKNLNKKWNVHLKEIWSFGTFRWRPKSRWFRPRLRNRSLWERHPTRICPVTRRRFFRTVMRKYDIGKVEWRRFKVSKIVLQQELHNIHLKLPTLELSPKSWRRCWSWRRSSEKFKKLRTAWRVRAARTLTLMNAMVDLWTYCPWKTLKAYIEISLSLANVKKRLLVSAFVAPTVHLWCFCAML